MNSHPTHSHQQEKLTLEILKKRPVFGIITAGLITITVLYTFGFLKSLPCGEGVLKGLNRSFIHINAVHIISNLFVFYILSRIEVIHGSKVFISLIIQLSILTTFIELLLHYVVHVPCSIGFSGILFGLAVWELIYDRSVNLALLLGISAMVVLPSLNNPKASLVGHGVGALSGLILASYYQPTP